MYVRRLAGKTLHFGHRGWLLDESFTFYDRETDSLWLQATGECVWGRYKGQQLSRLPVTHTSWGVWRRLHPQTRLLAKPARLVKRYREDSYRQYHARRGSQFGLAVFVGGRAKLYPLDELARRPLLFDRIGDQTVMIVFHPASRTGVAYSPVLGGRAVSFQLVGTEAADVLLRDPQTGQVWSGLTGCPRPARAGPPRASGQAGKHPVRLPRLHCTQFDLLNWLRHFPSEPIFGSK